MGFQIIQLFEIWELIVRKNKLSELNPIGWIYKASVSHNPSFEILLVSSLERGKVRIEIEERRKKPKRRKG